ncbi:hypothetical protein RvY_05623, partial [Ramazzottius varieornatus]
LRAPVDVSTSENFAITVYVRTLWSAHTLTSFTIIGWSRGRASLVLAHRRAKEAWRTICASRQRQTVECSRVLIQDLALHFAASVVDNGCRTHCGRCYSDYTTTKNACQCNPMICNDIIPLDYKL